jgi:hypothetical protein
MSKLQAAGLPPDPIREEVEEPVGTTKGAAATSQTEVSRPKASDWEIRVTRWVPFPLPSS